MTERVRKNTEDKIKKFLSERPAISVNFIESESKVAQGTISKAIKDKRSLTIESIEKIVPILKKYGYK